MHLDLNSPLELQTSPRRLPSLAIENAGSSMPQDPFYVSSDERSRNNSYSNDPDRQYGGRPAMAEVYSSSVAGPSMASLIGQHRGHFEHEEAEVDDGHREDDEAHLTANMSHAGMGDALSEGRDLENDGAGTPHSRRRTLRYSTTPSPLKKTGTAMQSVSKSLRRMSLRVVNLANTGLEGQLRLRDVDDKKSPMPKDDEDDDDEEGPPRRDLKQVMPIRGRTLGFLGPESKTRHMLFRFLVHPYVSSLGLSCSRFADCHLDTLSQESWS